MATASACWDLIRPKMPLALQLGGSDPGELSRAAAIGADWGYNEINLNVGCPSDRVQKGRFGACLMKEPALVRDCLSAMRESVDVAGHHQRPGLASMNWTRRVTCAISSRPWPRVASRPSSSMPEKPGCLA